MLPDVAVPAVARGDPAARRLLWEVLYFPEPDRDRSLRARLCRRTLCRAGSLLLHANCQRYADARTAGSRARSRQSGHGRGSRCDRYWNCGHRDFPGYFYSRRELVAEYQPDGLGGPSYEVIPSTEYRVQAKT